MKYDFVIERKPPSLNDLLALRGAAIFARTSRGKIGAYYKAKRIRQQWFELMPRPASDDVVAGFRFVRLTRLMSKRERAYDDDNFAGGCKPIRDALVDAGLIWGDSSRDAQFEYRQIYSELGPALGVMIDDEPIP